MLVFTIDAHTPESYKEVKGVDALERVRAGLRSIARDTKAFSNVRGLGSLVAFTLESPEARGQALERLFDRQVLALASGPSSIRFRLPLVITADEVDELLNRVRDSVA